MTDKAIIFGTDRGGADVGVYSKVFTTHTAILGMTGSGKTGLVIGMAEELIKNDIPIVILDIKGDMPNIFMQKDNILLGKIHPRILTPGAIHGESINVTSGLSSPEKLSESVSALLKLVGLRSDPIKSKPHTYISAILQNRQAKNQACELIDLVVAIQDPPFDYIGAMKVDEVLGSGARKALAAKLNNVLVAPTFKHWRSGVALDVEALTEAPGPGKVPVVVYSIAHLANEDERMFAISLLFEEMVSWMRRQPGSDELKLVFMVDECFGLMPPKGGSATKTALLTMLKQGRAAGMGVVLATQNPMDIDYKGMANCGTWLIGRLQTVNDRKRIVEGVCSAVPGMEKKELETQVGSLRPRQFLLARGTRLKSFYSRTVGSTMVGPMDSADIGKLNTIKTESVADIYPIDVIWKGR